MGCGSIRTKNQGRDLHRGPSSSLGRTQLSRLALARFESRVLLIDEVDPALAAHDLAVFVARLRGLERIANFHRHDFRKGAGSSVAKMSAVLYLLPFAGATLFGWISGRIIGLAGGGRANP